MNQQNSPQTMEMATTPDDRYVVVLKVGGNELDDDTFLYGLAQAVRSLQEGGKQPVIVHGGGKAIADLQTKLGLKTQFLDGLRITSDADVDVVEMVLSGLINKRIVRALLSEHIQAAGISGVDNATVYVEKMWHPAGDLGRVGEIQDVDLRLLKAFFAADIVPVISPVSYGAFDGKSYNVNADHVAAAVAAKLGAIRLVFVSNVAGVLIADRVVRAVTADQAEAWIADGNIFGGMVPKVRSAIEAVRQGVVQAVITNIAGVLEESGTGIIGGKGS